MVSRSMLSRSINYNDYDCCLYHCEPKMRKIIFTKFVLIFLPLDGAFKIAIFKKEAVYLRCLTYSAE